MRQNQVTPSGIKKSPSKSRKGRPVKKGSGMGNELNDFLRPGDKCELAYTPESPRDRERDSASKFTTLSPEPVGIKNSSRMYRRQQLVKKKEEAQMKKRLEEERDEAEEAVAWDRLKKPNSENELFKIQCGRILLELPLVMDRYPPKHGEFGKYIGYEGEDYIYNLNKRTHEARREVAFLDEPEPDYDDRTDVDGDLPAPERREARPVNKFALMSSEEFEATQMYQEWLKEVDY
jgi:hypothetical protein